MYLSGTWLGVAPRVDTKSYVYKRDQIACSNYKKISKYQRPHNREDLFDHLVSMRIFTIILNKPSH